MGTDLENQENIEIFKLAPGDIDHLFRRSGLSGNSLSAFTYDAEQAATSSPTELFKVLTDSPNFQPIARMLLEPDLIIEFKRGGAGAADEVYYALRSAGNNNVLTQLTAENGDILLLWFDDWNAFLTWWSGLYTSPGMDSYKNVFSGTMAIEVLVCAIHCVDVYRRSYMESMLEYRAGVDLALAAQDFVKLLKRSLASGDKRWLLPTMFEVTPGLKNSHIALKPEHLEQIGELGFGETKEGVLTLGEQSRLMGTEFITSWLGGIGFQATALINGQERSLSRVFVTATAFTNHLFSFESGAQGETRFRHQADTSPELFKTLAGWMDALQKVIGGTVPAPTAEKAAPKMKFCGQCGTALTPGKKFCTNCGTPI